MKIKNCIRNIDFYILRQIKQKETITFERHSNFNPFTKISGIDRLVVKGYSRFPPVEIQSMF